jgi:hypothetical protein
LVSGTGGQALPVVPPGGLTGPRAPRRAAPRPGPARPGPAEAGKSRACAVGTGPEAKSGERRGPLEPSSVQSGV